MSSGQKVFKRIEKKYRISEEQYRSLIPLLEEKMRPDEYKSKTIFSLYFDTEDDLLIRRSIDKPVYKEKLRVRTYGIPDDDSMTFVEIKKKFKKVVYKRRVAMSYKDARAFLTEGRPPEKFEGQQQIIDEISWFLKFYKTLRPSILITYDRNAYYSKEDRNLRITFDNNIKWRKEKLSPQDGVWGRPVIEEGQRIMEIKTAGAMPLWLVSALSEAKIYPTSFSKVGTAYKQDLLEGGRKYA